MSDTHHRLIHGGCHSFLNAKRLKVDCIFADPPDNIGLDYGNGSKDKKPDREYIAWLRLWLGVFVECAPVVWLSYNAKWTFEVGGIVNDFLDCNCELRAKLCIQTFTFGQHNKHDLGNCYRPLLRLMRSDNLLYPDQIRVPSWRQKNGDKRGDPRGRVPGDVFDFPRVTGNSKQRRKWCPTQLHEGLIERCIKLSTKEGDTILDPFAGTGTTLRVCKRINRRCTLIESNKMYCAEIEKEHDLEIEKP